MSTASVADLLQRARGLQLDLPLGVLDDAGASACAFCFISSRKRFGVRARLREDLVRLAARLGEELRATPRETLQLLLRLPRIVERLADRLLTALERLEQRPPGKLRQQRHAGPGT